MPERISNTIETQESYLPAVAPVAGSINNIYPLVDFSGRWKRSPGFSTHGEDTGLEITQGFRIGGTRPYVLFIDCFCHSCNATHDHIPFIFIGW
jgi:hypothetical protein